MSSILKITFLLCAHALCWTEGQEVQRMYQSDAYVNASDWNWKINVEKEENFQQHVTTRKGSEHTQIMKQIHKELNINDKWNSNISPLAIQPIKQHGDDVAAADLCSKVCALYHMNGCSAADDASRKLSLDEILTCIPKSYFSIRLSGFNFGTIRNDSFIDRPKISSMSFIDCNVTLLELDALRGLDNLTQLIIVDLAFGTTGLLYLNRYMLHHSPNVYWFTVGQIRHIESDAFLAFRKLEYLTLHHKDLLGFPHSFMPLSELKEIRLDSIGLTQVPKNIFHLFLKLEKAYLRNNRITSLGSGEKITGGVLLEVFLQNNRITEITKAGIEQFRRNGRFDRLSLFLQDNDIRFIEPGAFSPVSWYWTLAFNGNVNLGNANFKNLVNSLQNRRIFYLLVVGCGLVIDKFNSSILQPLNSSYVSTLHIGDNVIGSVELDAFEPVNGIIEIEISNFLHISPNVFASLPYLSGLQIHDVSVMTTSRYKVTVNLNNFTYLNRLSLYRIDYQRIYFNFANLSSYVRLFNFSFLGEAFDHYHNQVMDIFRANRFLIEHIDLSGNLMFRYRDDQLCALINQCRAFELALKENHFSRIPSCMFQNVSVQYLDLSRNRITYIQSGLFINMHDKLRKLDLSENAIRTIEGNALYSDAFYNTAFINLTNNLMACNCENQPFVNWMKSDHIFGHIIIIYDKYCRGPTGETNEELMKLDLSWEDCNPDLMTRNIILIVLSCIVAIIITISLLRYFKQDIKYMLMVRKAKHNLGNVQMRNMDGEEVEIYDAFVSYHSEKRRFLFDVMVPEITKGDVPFTLIYDYEILPGQESYLSGIMTHMDRSLHIIFLVTRGWMKEGWNEFEMESAIDMLTQSKRHTLIVILMENIPQKEMSKTLAMMVRHNVCLRWSEEQGKQRKFWRDLKLELGKRRYDMVFREH